MGSRISPWTAVIVIAAIVLVIAVLWWTGASPGKQAAQIDKDIASTVVGGGGKGPGMPPPTAPKSNAPSAVPVRR